MPAIPTYRSSEYVTITLHSHLPYVVNHGTWPHGLEWLSEAAAETYLPILRVLGELEREGIALKAQHQPFSYSAGAVISSRLQRRVSQVRAAQDHSRQQDQKQFAIAGNAHMASVAEYWQAFFDEVLRDFNELGGDIIGGFRHFNDIGAIEVFTCAATHGYFPLLGTDASIRAQVRTGVETHKKHLGKAPRGIWIPECGYRPAGSWTPPVSMNGASPRAFQRAGVEQILAENGLEYFFIDTHLVEQSAIFTPYEVAGDVPVALELEGEPRASFYQPFFADTPNRRQAQVAFFTRDPRTSIQVWSGDHGYPGDGDYLEFHKKQWPGGHRYWRVTGPKVDLGEKQAYHPEWARQKTRDHARHFVHIAHEAISKNPTTPGVPPILTAPFDAELFGHWWFEGPQFLAHVAREFAKPESPIKLITCGEYLDQTSAQGLPRARRGIMGQERH